MSYFYPSYLLPICTYLLELIPKSSKNYFTNFFLRREGYWILVLLGVVLFLSSYKATAGASSADVTSIQDLLTYKKIPSQCIEEINFNSSDSVAASTHPGFATQPSITSQPTHQTVCAGASATFSAIAVNANSYQWQYLIYDNWVDISSNEPAMSGVQTTTLTIANASYFAGRNFRLRASDTSGQEIYSESAYLGVSNIKSTLLIHSVTAYGGADGSAEATNITGGVAPYLFTCAPKGGIAPAVYTSKVYNLTAGNYTFTITDANHCSFAVDFNISQPAPNPAQLSTLAASSVKATSAIVGGNITSNGGTSITERGIIYSSSAIPTLADTTTHTIKVPMGTGMGNFSQPINGLTGGTIYSVRAYAVNAAGPAYGNVETFTTPKADQFITFKEIGMKTFGDPSLILPAISTSKLPVSFSVLTGPAIIDGTTLTIIGAGVVRVRASQKGNTQYNPAIDQEQSFSVSKASPTISWNTPSQITYGTPLSSKELNANASFEGQALKGIYTYSPSIGTLLSAGKSQPLSVTFTPTDELNFSAISVTSTISVEKNNQTITFDTLQDRSYSNSPFQLQVSSSSLLPVSFVLVSGPAILSGNVLTMTKTGEVTIRATQDGSANYHPALSIERTFTIHKATQEISFLPISSKTVQDVPFELQATSSSGLPVTFEVLSGPAKLSSNILTLIGEGEVMLRAKVEENEQYQKALSLTQTFCVLPLKPTITSTNYLLHSSSQTGNQWFLNGELLEGETKQELFTHLPGEYTVHIKGSCGDVYAEAITVSTSIMPDMGVAYPNPATTQVSLALPLGSTYRSAILLDTKGKEVAYPVSADNNQVLFDTSRLGKGIYMIEAQTSTGVILHRIAVY